MKTQTSIKSQRNSFILREIFKNRQITRSELAEKMDLSLSAIVKYIDELREAGWVREVEKQNSAGGRPAGFVELVPRTLIAAGMVLNPTYIQGALLDERGEILAQERRELPGAAAKAEHYAAIIETAEALRKRAAEKRVVLSAAGVALGGEIDTRQGVSIRYLGLPDWHNVELGPDLERCYGVSCRLVNDVDACALGEKYYGCLRGETDFLCVWLDEAVGLSLFFNDRLYSGRKGNMGELGHTMAVPEGKQCFCGQKGCLESYIKEQALLAEAQAGLSAGVFSEMTREAGGARLNMTHLKTAANCGDRFAMNIFNAAADLISSKLSDLVSVLFPPVVLLRGSIIDGNPYLFEAVRSRLFEKSLRYAWEDLRLLYAKDYKDLRPAGVSSWVLDHFLADGGLVK